MSELQMPFKSSKGYHFEQGAYVEYIGKLDPKDLEPLKN